MRNEPQGIITQKTEDNERIEDEYCLRYLPKEHHYQFRQWRSMGHSREDFEWCLMDITQKVYAMIKHPERWSKYKD